MLPEIFGFIPPTIKNTKDVSNLNTLENYDYHLKSPSSLDLG
jgi:hypothetical protein